MKRGSLDNVAWCKAVNPEASVSGNRYGKCVMSARTSRQFALRQCPNNSLNFASSPRSLGFLTPPCASARCHCDSTRNPLCPRTQLDSRLPLCNSSRTVHLSEVLGRSVGQSTSDGGKVADPCVVALLVVRLTPFRGADIRPNRTLNLPKSMFETAALAHANVLRSVATKMSDMEHIWATSMRPCFVFCQLAPLAGPMYPHCHLHSHPIPCSRVKCLIGNQHGRRGYGAPSAKKNMVRK